MKKLILISLICLFGFLQANSQSYIFRIKVRIMTNQGWTKDTVFCLMYHEAKNFNDVFQIFDYKIYASQSLIGTEDACIDRNQFRTKYYCWTNNNIKDTVRYYLSLKYNVALNKVDYLSGGQ
jgi:hypothetical protein